MIELIKSYAVFGYDIFIFSGHETDFGKYVNYLVDTVTDLIGNVCNLTSWC